MQQIIAIGKKLGIDPIMDSDLTWIVEEYINAPLPDEWSVVRAPNGAIHYINSRTRDNVLDNPIEPRYRKLVEIIKDARRDKAGGERGGGDESIAFTSTLPRTSQRPFIRPHSPTFAHIRSTTKA